MNPVFEWGLDFMQALQAAVGAARVDLTQFFTFLGNGLSPFGARW